MDEIGEAGGKPRTSDLSAKKKPSVDSGAERRLGEKIDRLEKRISTVEKDDRIQKLNDRVTDFENDQRIDKLEARVTEVENAEPKVIERVVAAPASSNIMPTNQKVS